MAEAETERQHSVAALRQQLERDVLAMNEALERWAAIYRCDKCREEKEERDDVWQLPNGLQFRASSWHCRTPGPDCTAQVHAHLPSVSATIANRIIESVIQLPELKAVGATYWICGGLEVERVVLSYPAPAGELVLAAVGQISVERFREQG
jgi:hypothetical protein